MTKEVRERKQELEQAHHNAYPRLVGGSDPIPVNAFKRLILEDSNRYIGRPQVAAGRIMAIRLSGKKLVFFDLQAGQTTMQLTLNHAVLQGPKPTPDEFRDQCRLLRRGDHITVEALVAPTEGGKLSLQAVNMPVLQSPCLQRLPIFASERAHESDSDYSSDRYVDMLTSPSAMNVMRARHHLFITLRNFFIKKGFCEVQTPILTAQAGGATARPFETTASEFPHRKLALRVAPELWLKRLVIGGMTRIYEIGPCFRNEGLDKTHNPEFSTCEFYAAYWTLPQLKEATETILMQATLRLALMERKDSISMLDSLLAYDILPESDTDLANPDAAAVTRVPKAKSFKTVDFIPSLNTLLGVDLPNLSLPSARKEVLAIFKSKDIPVPDKPTLPRLLDKLSSHLLEPHCHHPTWIENIPECLSPLSKSFIHPTAPNSQPVAARAELFIRGKEVVNCYEEENDPFEQRRKFVEQQKYARDPDSGEVDEEADED